MNKKIVVILMSLLLLSTLAGCISEDKPIEHNTYRSSNSAPVPVVTAPEMAYFGKAIEFDASESYDEDGIIEIYIWRFGDDSEKEGVRVTHTFTIPDDFNPNKTPYIYLVQLDVVDNNGSYSHYVGQIRLFLLGYIFHLGHSKLMMEKPSSNRDTIRPSSGIFKFNPPQELTYELPDSINIQTCTWNATIYIEKPQLTIVNRVSLILYNESGEMIAKADSNFRLFDFRKEKTVLIKGEINKPEEFKSIKLVVYGFSLREKVSILYGGEKASQICFDFTSSQ